MDKIATIFIDQRTIREIEKEDELYDVSAITYK